MLDLQNNIKSSQVYGPQPCELFLLMFGEMLHLDCIPTEYWVPFICSRFEKYGKSISEEYATRICETIKNYSSYVQQFAWNVMAETEKEVNEETLQSGISALLQQCHGLFVQQTEGLTTLSTQFSAPPLQWRPLRFHRPGCS